MIGHLRNAINGTNAAFYDRFRLPYGRAAASLNVSLSNSRDWKVYQATEMGEFLVGTLAILQMVFLGTGGSTRVFDRKALLRLSIEKSEALFCLLLVGIIRQCTVADRDEGDIFCNLVNRIVPRNLVHLTRKLSSEMRLCEIEKCEQKLCDIFERFFPPLDWLSRLSLSAAALPICATLNADRFARLERLPCPHDRSFGSGNSQ